MQRGLDIVSRPEIDVTQMEKGKSFIFTAEVAVKPEVTLGDYKGVEIDKIDTTVTEEELNAEIDRVRDQNSRTVIFTNILPNQLLLKGVNKGMRT